MKSQKVSKSIRGSKRKVPDAGTPEYAKWRAKVVAGKRQSKARRQKAGLRTVREIARQYGVPVSFVGRMADRGEIGVIESGPRRFIHENEAVRVFGGTQSAA
jgi:hypothetical protein